MRSPEKAGESEAELEAAADLAWLRENITIFWPAAHYGYEQVGRGAVAILFKTESPEDDEDPVFGYYSQEIIDQDDVEEVKRLVAEYDPQQEFVAVVLKPDRANSYRLAVEEPLVKAANAAANREPFIDRDL